MWGTGEGDMIYKTRSSPQNCRGFDPVSSIDYITFVVGVPL